MYSEVKLDIFLLFKGTHTQFFTITVCEIHLMDPENVTKINKNPETCIF